MGRKLTRKEKIKLREESKQPIVIRQGNFVKRTSYCLILMGLFCGITVLPGFKLPEGEIDLTYVIVLTIMVSFFVWMFILLPFHLITTIKTIILEKNQIIIESNKKKYSIDTNEEKLVWWRKLNTEYGEIIDLKFHSKKISLLFLEFTNLFELEKFLRQVYANKEKAKR